MKYVLVGAVVTISLLLVAVYLTPTDGASEAQPSSSAPAPKSESFNLN